MKEQNMNDFYNSSNLPINGYVPKETDKIYYDFGKYIPLDGLNPEDIVKMMQNNEEIEDKKNKITISGSVVQNETNQLYYILLKASEILKEDVNIHMTVDENEEEIIMKENTQEATSTEPVNKYCKITNVRISTSSENDNTIYIDNIYNQNGSGNFNITLFDVIENEENKISETEHEYGTNIQLTVNDIEGYELTKWEVISDSNTITGNTNTIEFIMPEENVVIKCYYTLREYTITWEDENGEELGTSTVKYGETPVYTGETPTKEQTEQYTYEFIGWEPEISAVTGEATYTAKFKETKRQYTIKFMNGEEPLQETTVNYGDMPTYTGETPTKEQTEQYTYEFIGWEPEISAVSGDQTYTAKFKAKVREDEYIYITDCSDSPSEGATVNIIDGTHNNLESDFKFDTVSFGDVSSGTPYTKLSKDGYYELIFDKLIDLTNYEDVKLDLWWGVDNNNSGFDILVNDEESVVLEGKVNDKNDRNKLFFVTTGITEETIQKIKIRCTYSNGTVCFRIGIKGTPKKFSLTVNENEIGNFKAGEDISQYLTFEEKEGMTHKWMEGETEFIGSVMPNRDLVLTSKYEDKPEVQNILYYNGVLNNDIDTINSDIIKTEFNKLEFEDGEQQGIQIQLPVLDDNAAWDEYYEKEMLGEAEEWMNTYGFKYYIAIPQNSTIVITDSLGSSVSLDKKENGITIDGIEYDIYLSRNSMVPTSTTETHGLTIKITL